MVPPPAPAKPQRDPLLHGSRARARLHTACKKTEFLQGCIPGSLMTHVCGIIVFTIPQGDCYISFTTPPGGWCIIKTFRA
jgi:hypothetical protein